MRRAVRITSLVALGAGAAGCFGDREPRVRDVTLDMVRPLVTSESGLLGSPFDVAVDERGRVYVLDYQMDRVVVLDGSSPPRMVGRSGAGPGELHGATSLAVSRDTLRIVDRGNGRIQVLTLDGRYARSYGLAKQTMGSEASITRDGATAFATYGIHSQALARVYDGVGRMQSELGRVVAPTNAVWDLTLLKQEIAKGRVPRPLLNRARPVLGREGAWLVHLAEPTVARYDAQGALLWSRALDTPDLNRIRENFFAKNRAETRQNAFFPLTMFSDAVAAGDALWVLLNGGEDDPAKLLLLSPEGELLARVQVPGAIAPRQVAVDPAGSTLYLALSDASLVAVEVPEGLRFGDAAAK